MTQLYWHDEIATAPSHRRRRSASPTRYEAILFLMVVPIGVARQEAGFRLRDGPAGGDQLKIDMIVRSAMGAIV